MFVVADLLPSMHFGDIGMAAKKSFKMAA